MREAPGQPRARHDLHYPAAQDRALTHEIGLSSTEIEIRVHDVDGTFVIADCFARLREMPTGCQEYTGIAKGFGQSERVAGGGRRL